MAPESFVHTLRRHASVKSERGSPIIMDKEPIVYHLQSSVLESFIDPCERTPRQRGIESIVSLIIDAVIEGN